MGISARRAKDFSEWQKARERAEVVVLEPPENFLSAVGAHYQHFEQVGDEEVVQLLRGERKDI